ncbi:hypothetical protein CIPAW_12G037800 [Carya illinoinensis]|uniref:Uncharacterized protein n=1 Tax=Carya illinoinensis TaxID=32201 RepID=A0A8T1NWW3_CARIL|nr:hypothetical protein I3842_Q110900 [Carya illinoinensis]KAG6633287.1 hypothetical protein CIPAW_12G037800 [Carya illinoinensis]
MQTECLGLGNRIEKKAAYLQELEEQTRPRATFEVEISKDMQLVHFDFNSWTDYVESGLILHFMVVLVVVYRILMDGGFKFMCVY